jgi:Tol biopolymer transport system component
LKYKVLRRHVAFSASAILLVIALTILLQRRFLPRQFQNDGETLIASESSPIYGKLVANRGNLYFSAWQAGRIVLLTAPESGGPVREIPSPFVQAQPQAVSNDGTRLLVLVGIGQEMERQLWWLPLHGGNPFRIGETLCHSAELSPDGHILVYAFGSAIYLAADFGTKSHMLYNFSGVPTELRWSMDGMRIFALVSDSSEHSAIWKLSLDGHNPIILNSVDAISRVPFRDGSLSPALDSEDDFFFIGNKPNGAIALLETPRLLWPSTASIQEFASTHGAVSDIALDRESHNIYYTRETPGRSELILFDQRSRIIRPFLAGVSAHDVDFSHDGRWIAYVNHLGSPANTLWVARSDGSGARQIDTSGMEDLELPRWSPDGKRLAFMGRRTAERFRIYVVPSSGGEPQEASRSNDDQGAPTWSPDGRTLVYGRVLCQEENTCAIYRIDLTRGQVAKVVGSEGLSTARWSPDGRYIAALRSDTHELYLLDERIGKWRRLAEGVNGNDLTWSADSGSIYASRPDGAEPAIIRVSLSGNVHEAFDLSTWSKLTGRIDTWFALTPEGSLVFARMVTGGEIVAVHYRKW